MQIWSAEIKEIDKLLESVRGRFPDLEKEMEQLVNTGDANVVLLYSGRCLEVIVSDLSKCELKRPRKTEPLRGIIDNLNKEEKIPGHIFASMQSLNSLSAFGTHPEEFDPEQVKPVLNNLTIIIRWYLKYKDSQTIIRAGSEGEQKKEVTGGIFRKLKIKYSLPIALLLALVIFFLFSSGSTLPFSKRDWVIITDFENLTDNPVFDKSLYTAFSLSTSQSRYINVFPRSRMLETLPLMEIKDRAYVDEKTGREMAIRKGINIYIVPGISEEEKRFTITAKIMETKSGNLLKSETIYAKTQDEILPALDKLSRKLRRNLGESRYNIAAQDKPLADATTSSLEALKQYTLGVEHHAARDYTGAKKCYEIALQIDTGFTTAKAMLGSINIESFNPVKGRELMNQAVKTADKLTDRERLTILATHAINVEKDNSKSIAYTKKLIGLYPDDPVYHNNLGVNYERSGKFEEALEEYKTTVKIDPDIVIAYGAILWIYLQNLVRIDSALVWAEKLISDNPQNAWGYFFLGTAYISIDSIAKAETAFERARETNPYFIINLYDLAHTYRIQGRYKEANRILEKIPEINKTETISAYYCLGANYQSMGNQQEAGKYFSILKDIYTQLWTKEYPDDPRTYTSISAVTARLGDMDSSKLMLQKAIEMDSTLHVRFAEVLCVQGRIPEALDEIEKALNNGYRRLFWLKLNPEWNALQYDVRFRNMLDKYFK